LNLIYLRSTHRYELVLTHFNTCRCFSHDCSEDFLLKVFNAMGQSVNPIVEEEFTDKELTIHKVKKLNYLKAYTSLKLLLVKRSLLRNKL
jgi:hypothetical protein